MLFTSEVLSFAFVIGQTTFFHWWVFIVRVSYWLIHFTYHFYIIFFLWGNLSIYDIIVFVKGWCWLWRWLLLRLSKRQSPTTVLFRTTFTWTITLYELLILLGSNHLQHHCTVKLKLSVYTGCKSSKAEDSWGTRGRKWGNKTYKKGN